MMRILLTGKDGQVGWDLQRALAPLGEVAAFGSAELDLGDPDALRAQIRALKPHWIVNPAAYTAVDKAESEPERAAAVNAVAPGVLAEEAARISAALVHYSTDYVYAGDKGGAYVETDPTAPLSAYGRTKLQGEQAIAAAGGRHWIFRTAWVYSNRGKNFLHTMLRLARERPQLRVVADQIGAPTWSRMIAQATAALIAQQMCRQTAGGTYHLTAAGSTSWHGFAARIVELGAQAGLCPEVPVQAIGTADYPTPARRPANSVLSNAKLSTDSGICLPDWEQSLRLCLAEMRPA
jgi:dTDP-4-dehydrorhamnose reductase